MNLLIKSGFYSAIREMANGNDELWGAKPDDIIGYPVIFNDMAVIPVVGDFNYSRQNYDLRAIYETDKDAEKGEYYFVLTAWGDHKIRLTSTFRLAIIRVMLIGAVIETESEKPKAGDELTVFGLTFNDGGTGSGGSITYQWQYLNGDTWTDDDTRTGNDTAMLTTVDDQDEGMSFRCRVTFADGDGRSEVVTGVVTLA